MTIILAKFGLKWRRIRGPKRQGNRCIRAEGAHEGSSLGSLDARTLSPQTPPPPPGGKRERSSFTHVFPSFSIDDQDSSPMPNSVPDLTAIRLPTSTSSKRNGSFDDIRDTDVSFALDGSDEKFWVLIQR